MIAIWVEPNERREAIEAYRPRLTDAMIAEIEDAPEAAIIRLFFNICGDPTMNSVQVTYPGQSK